MKSKIISVSAIGGICLHWFPHPSVYTESGPALVYDVHCRACFPNDKQKFQWSSPCLRCPLQGMFLLVISKSVSGPAHVNDGHCRACSLMYDVHCGAYFPSTKQKYQYDIDVREHASIYKLPN